MILKVSFVLFLCALYCTDGKPWAHKPRPINHDIVERFLQEGSKTQGVVEPSEDDFKQGEEDVRSKGNDRNNNDEVSDKNSSEIAKTTEKPTTETEETEETNETEETTENPTTEIGEKKVTAKTTEKPTTETEETEETNGSEESTENPTTEIGEKKVTAKTTEKPTTETEETEETNGSEESTENPTTEIGEKKVTAKTTEKPTTETEETEETNGSEESTENPTTEIGEKKVTAKTTEKPTTETDEAEETEKTAKTTENPTTETDEAEETEKTTETTENSTTESGTQKKNIQEDNGEKNWLSNDEENEINGARQYRDLINYDFNENPDTINLEVGEKYQPLPSVKSSNFHHPYKIPFQRFPAPVLQSISQASRQRNHPRGNPLEFGTYRRNNDNGRDFNVENLNHFNNGEPLDRDKFQLTKLREFKDDTALSEPAPEFRLKVADLTEYVRKAIARSLSNLPNKILSGNPPLIIEEVPGVPIKLQSKYVEGFSSLVLFDKSEGFYTNKFFAFTKAKFNQLRFSYNVQINPFGMFMAEQNAAGNPILLRK